MPYSKTVDILFCDCDPAGIMFYANIFFKAHYVYESWLRSAVKKKDYFDDPDYATPLTKVSAEYFKPMRAGLTVKVNMSLADITETNYSLNFSFETDNKKFAEVSVTHTFIDRNIFKKTKIDDLLRTALQQLKD